MYLNHLVLLIACNLIELEVMFLKDWLEGLLQEEYKKIDLSLFLVALVFLILLGNLKSQDQKLFLKEGLGVLFQLFQKTSQKLKK